MNIELIEEKNYSCRVGERTITGMKAVGEWEGMVKLKHVASDQVLIVLLDQLKNEHRIVTGSPSLLVELQPIVNTEGFIRIPEVKLPNGTAVPSFLVGQYACVKGDDGKAVVTADRTPWVNITYHDARKACEASGTKLITELQCLAIAHDIAQQDINWTGGKVGEGHIYQGLHKGTVSRPQAGTFESSDPDERRWHQLSNGQRIYDFAGNVFTWVFDDVQGDADGLVANKISADSISLTTAPYPSTEKGMGYRPDGERDWSGLALVRGGCWSSGSNAGVFRLDLGWPDHGRDGVGFRCTQPQASGPWSQVAA